ncbi:hypothetical protein QYE76_023644 [Lolium multiflorum]|uniref:Leucine-rich repeat-containing N-terminal plant-type domain-containing protein n=1 Tax=Lolium multiflorum TaxID=4521 RepID=A0AAD8RBT5_LOLMU|nr:hypothetical protein QYE76_023644 [Lolium multiflorum]
MGPQPAEHPTHSSHTTTTRQTHAETAPVLSCCVPGGAEVMRSPKQPAKLAMLLLLAFLLLCDEVGNVHGKTIHENSVDLHALLDFKKGITNDPPALSNWNTTIHFCLWNGVHCTTTRPFRISSLNLTGQNLQGHITSSLGNLSFLNQLDLSYNSLFGTIPILNHLQQVQNFYVNNNNLTGINPDALSNCSSLVSLDFSSNLLVGIIPPKLGFLLNLEYINFKSNKLEGSVPDEFGKLPKLQQLLLADNRLSGEFPQSIGNLTSLKNLVLTGNNLSGEVPQSIGKLTQLIELSLGNNKFEGPLPLSLGQLTQLTRLFLGNNKFEGPIP